jgi:hypothetical protein
MNQSTSLSSLCRSRNALRVEVGPRQCHIKYLDHVWEVSAEALFMRMLASMLRLSETLTHML